MYDLSDSLKLSSDTLFEVVNVHTAVEMTQETDEDERWMTEEDNIPLSKLMQGETRMTFHSVTSGRIRMRMTFHHVNSDKVRMRITYRSVTFDGVLNHHLLSHVFTWIII